MDNVLVDFPSGINRIDQETREKYSDHLDDVPGIFALMDPMQDAIESYHILAEKYATFILTTAPWNNPSAWMDKLHWVKTHLGEVAYKRLIITHRKDLNKGDFLIDDRENNGAGNIEGTLIRFGSETFPDWQSVTSFLLAAFEHGEDNESIFSALSPDDEDHTPSCPMELIISFQKGDFSEDGTNNFSGKFILDVQRDWEESFHNKFAPFYANVIEGHPLAMLRLTKYMDAGEETDYDFGMELINGEIDIDTNLEMTRLHDSVLDAVFS